MFKARYADVYKGDEHGRRSRDWWREPSWAGSTYIQNPPFRGMSMTAAGLTDIVEPAAGVFGIHHHRSHQPGRSIKLTARRNYLSEHALPRRL
jgi:hypothetical protein